MSESNNKRAIAVGVFIILGLLFLVAGVLTIGNLHSTFQRKITVSTIFNDVNGLQAGNNIWFSGVKIGTVKKMEFYGKSQVRVIMNINSESRDFIRRDSKVKLSTDGLIGNKILVIYGGSSDAGPVQEGDMLGNETQLSTDEILSTVQQNNLNLLTLTQRLVDGQGTIGKLLTQDSVYYNIAATTRSLQDASARANTLLAELNRFGTTLNNKDGLVNDLLTDTLTFQKLSASVSKLQQTVDTASVFIRDLKKAGSNPRSPVGVLLRDEQAGASLKSTIMSLETSSKKLDQDLEALQHNFLLRRYFKKEAKKEKDSIPE